MADGHQETIAARVGREQGNGLWARTRGLARDLEVALHWLLELVRLRRLAAVHGRTAVPGRIPVNVATPEVGSCD